MTKEQVAYFVDLFRKVRATPDWKEFVEKGAFKDTFMHGDEYANWIEKADKLHYELMKSAGFLAKAP